MTVNGNVTIATYFILNKKDRGGKVIPRPFQAVLDQMKRQDTEDAKIKQSSSLKGTNMPSPLPPAAAPPKENGYVQQPPPEPAPISAPVPIYQQQVNDIRNDPISIPVPVKMVRNDEVSSHYVQNPIIKNRMNEEQSMRPPEMMSEQYNSNKSYDGNLQRSRACQLL